jgi:hypothetical protein
VLERIQRMLERCDTDDRVMPPTELFNEGWLLRLTLDWFSLHPEVGHVLSVPRGARWYSEALLASRFLPRTRGDHLAESYTHADGVIGHFEIGNSGEGDLTLKHDAQQFVVVEAKLRSKLSAGTKNAPEYDQAARNIACMAHILSIEGPRPEMMERLGFVVLAPASQIERGVFQEQLSADSIRKKVTKRVAAYQDPERDAWLAEWFLPMLERIDVAALSWEEIADFIGQHEEEVSKAFRTFYDCCLEHNRLERTEPPT